MEKISVSLKLKPRVHDKCLFPPGVAANETHAGERKSCETPVKIHVASGGRDSSPIVFNAGFFQDSFLKKQFWCEKLVIFSL